MYLEYLEIVLEQKVSKESWIVCIHVSRSSTGNIETQSRETKGRDAPDRSCHEQPLKVVRSMSTPKSAASGSRN